MPERQDRRGTVCTRVTVRVRVHVCMFVHVCVCMCVRVYLIVTGVKKKHSELLDLKSHLVRFLFGGKGCPTSV